MAIVKIKDVPVTFVNGRGYGVKVTESHESKGKTFKQGYTLWFTEPHNLTVGDVISVSGFLSAKVGEPWTDRDGNERTSVELSVNSPRLEDPRADADTQYVVPPSDIQPPFGSKNDSSPVPSSFDGDVPF